MTGPRPLVIFWQEILPGDLLKMEAQSSDAGTGGGARDLRFPDEPFRPVLERMFPNDEARSGRPIRTGMLVWEDTDGHRQTQQVEYWPPTEARPMEGRLARIHAIEPLRNPPDPKGSQLILLIVLDDTGDVRAYYTTSAELGAEWHEDVSGPILRCLAEHRRENVSARGWIEPPTGRSYCHGA